MVRSGKYVFNFLTIVLFRHQLLLLFFNFSDRLHRKRSRSRSRSPRRHRRSRSRSPRHKIHKSA